MTEILCIPHIIFNRMATPSFALFFLCFLGTNMTHLTALKLALKFESAEVGQNVTLKCKCDISDMMMCYWFKQSFGQKPKLLSTFFSHKDTGDFQKEFSDNRRFHLDVGRKKNDLTISNLRISDSATYFCAASNLYAFEFCEGVTVSVQGSGLTTQTSVHQSVSGTNQTRRSVTLSCTVHTRSCDKEHRVYWFKSSRDTHQGLIYTRGDGNNQCERKPDAQSHTCFYNLPIQSWNQSHAGTYYCVVTACGRILFGNGTTPGFKAPVGKTESSPLVYFLGTALAFTSILGLSLAFMLYRLNKRLQCADSGATFRPTNSMLNEDGETVQYATVKEFTGKTSRRKTATTSECVYSSIKE